MTTVYVERRDGAIAGVYARPQPGYAEEEIADDHPDVVAFMAPPEPVKARDLAAELDALKVSLKGAKSIADINAAATLDVAAVAEKP